MSSDIPNSNGIDMVSGEIDLREAFALFDKAGTGRISTKDLSVVMRSLGQNPTELELQEMINEVSHTGSGTIDYIDFAAMMDKKMRNIDGFEELKEAFSIFDPDGKGYITAKDLKFILSNLGESMKDEDVENMIMEADLDADGHINFDEFVTIMRGDIQR